MELTHWGRVMHKCVSKLPIIGSDNGLSPGRRQAIIWTNDGLLWIIVNLTHGNKLQWNLNRNPYIFIQENAFENVVWKMAAICLGLNVLILLGRKLLFKMDLHGHFFCHEAHEAFCDIFSFISQQSWPYLKKYVTSFINNWSWSGSLHFWVVNGVVNHYKFWFLYSF